MLTIGFWMCDVLGFRKLVFLDLTDNLALRDQMSSVILSVDESEPILAVRYFWTKLICCVKVKVLRNFFNSEALLSIFCFDEFFFIQFQSGILHILFSSATWCSIGETKMYIWNSKPLFEVIKNRIFLRTTLRLFWTVRVLKICCVIGFEVNQDRFADNKKNQHQNHWLINFTHQTQLSTGFLNHSRVS